MKMTKCDRCNAINETGVEIEVSESYDGISRLVTRVDLCHECNGNLMRNFIYPIAENKIASRPKEKS